MTFVWFSMSIKILPFIFFFFFFWIQQEKLKGLYYLLSLRKAAMHLAWVVVLTVLYYCTGVGTSVAKRPEVVDIGSIFTFDSVIGRVAKIALEAAVEDVNSSPDILQGTMLKLTMHDSNSSGFLGILEALKFMEGDTIAIIGPQSSLVAHVISHVANELRVPMLSFSATDPTLASLQYPYFIRTTQSDLFGMSAIADMIQYYEWKKVIAIYIDDDHGRNGIFALADELAARRCEISYKVPLRIEATQSDIRDALINLVMMESRVIVVHAYVDRGLDILAVAQHLGMMDTGYVWFSTDWLSTLLDSRFPLSSEASNSIQGVITLRMYTPDSQLKKNFVSRWSNLTRKDIMSGPPLGLSTYGLYAYDTVWLLAHAIDAFFRKGGNISFSSDPRLKGQHGWSLQLDAMTIFDEGSLLRESILQVNMTGITGPIKFTQDKNLIRPAFEVFNVVGTGVSRIGYWSNYSGLSVVPPDILYMRPKNRSVTSQQLYGVIWPGQTTQKPRGWVFPHGGRQLRIAITNRASYRELIAEERGTNMFKGYCIDVFIAALNLLPYAVPYNFIPYGDGQIKNPNVTELVQLITTGVYDAAVGDISITTSRTRMADFTQPYIESGLVVVVPVKKSNSSTWAFLKPFTREMWVVTAIFFVAVGAVVWILEHRINDDFRGPPRRQVVTTLWFSFSTMFFSHRESTVSTLGRAVLVIWLFVVLIINSSYTASLTSILTVQKLYSPIKGIETLVWSDDPIGYQQGSFSRNYLINELGIQESRLIPLTTPEDCEKALRRGPGNGGVAAVIDERAYVELFLSTRCDFSIVGHEFTKTAWGFAFQRDSPLAVDLSTAILKLSENGDLQRIHDKWLKSRACISQGTKLQVERLPLKSFSGLFAICGVACFIALCMYLIRTIHQFIRHYSDKPEATGGSSRSARFQTFLSFADKKVEISNSKSKRRQMDGAAASTRNVEEDALGNGFNQAHEDIASNTSFSLESAPHNTVEV